jgi:hypothetical protein
MLNGSSQPSQVEGRLNAGFLYRNASASRNSIADILKFHFFNRITFSQPDDFDLGSIA